MVAYLDAAKTMSALHRVDEQSCRKTPLTEINPLSHLLVTLLYIVLVVSVGKYELSLLTPFLIYPIFMLVFGDIPIELIAKRVAFVLPAVLLLGIFNPILDKSQVSFGNFIVSAGWISFLVLIAKCVLTVAASLLLVCVTGIDGVSRALYSLKIPALLVVQLVLTYRYIHVLGEEIVLVLTAHKLRSGTSRGVSLKQFGSLCGGLFIRSTKRAESIYSAMRCRGFSGTFVTTISRPFSARDCGYVLVWVTFFVIIRSFNLPQLLGNLLIK